MDLNELAKLLVTLLLGGAGTWLAQQLKPKSEKRKDETSAERVSWELWRDQFAWAKTEIVDLRKQCEQQETRLARVSSELTTLELRHADLRAKHANLEQRQQETEAHIEDLYASISQEPDSGQAIKSRLKTKRPATS